MRAAAFFQQQETQNTNGGTATAGSWEDRKINTISSDLNSLISLNPVTGIITLQPGSYVVDIFTPFNRVDRFQSRLVNAGSGDVLILGQTGFTTSSTDISFSSRIYGVLTITTQTTVKVQSQVQSTRASYGYGLAANFASEIYLSGSISVLG